MGRLIAYVTGSTVLAGAVTAYAFLDRPNFYSATVFLSQSSACLIILSNLALVYFAGVLYGLQRLLFGPLRRVEIEQLWERGWIAGTEWLFALSIFREDFGVAYLATFILLFVGKVWGWMVDGRLDILEQQNPQSGRRFHARLTTATVINLVLPLKMASYCLDEALYGPRLGIMTMFTFEFGILLINALSTSIKYAFWMYEHRIIQQQLKERLDDLRQESLASGDPMPNEADLDIHDLDLPGWEAKSSFRFALDIGTGESSTRLINAIPSRLTWPDFLKFTAYLAFFGVLSFLYGLPIYIVRDLYMSGRSFFTRIIDYRQYRTATYNMHIQYPDATNEQLSDDNICIVCREEMKPWLGTLSSDEQLANRTSNNYATTEKQRPKRLPCGHTLHFSCLRSWLERQQTCPTCRRSVLTAPTPQPNAETRPLAQSQPEATSQAPQASQASQASQAPHVSQASPASPAAPAIPSLQSTQPPQAPHAPVASSSSPASSAPQPSQASQGPQRAQSPPQALGHDGQNFRRQGIGFRFGPVRFYAGAVYRNHRRVGWVLRLGPIRFFSGQVNGEQARRMIQNPNIALLGTRESIGALAGLDELYNGRSGGSMAANDGRRIAGSLQGTPGVEDNLALALHSHALNIHLTALEENVREEVRQLGIVGRRIQTMQWLLSELERARLETQSQSGGLATVNPILAVDANHAGGPSLLNGYQNPLEALPEGWTVLPLLPLTGRGDAAPVPGSLSSSVDVQPIQNTVLDPGAIPSPSSTQPATSNTSAAVASTSAQSSGTPNSGTGVNNAQKSSATNESRLMDVSEGTSSFSNSRSVPTGPDRIEQSSSNRALHGIDRDGFGGSTWNFDNAPVHWSSANGDHHTQAEPSPAVMDKLEDLPKPEPSDPSLATTSNHNRNNIGTTPFQATVEDLEEEDVD